MSVLKNKELRNPAKRNLDTIMFGRLTMHTKKDFKAKKYKEAKEFLLLKKINSNLCFAP